MKFTLIQLAITLLSTYTLAATQQRQHVENFIAIYQEYPSIISEALNKGDTELACTKTRILSMTLDFINDPQHKSLMIKINSSAIRNTLFYKDKLIELDSLCLDSHFGSSLNILKAKELIDDIFSDSTLESF